jgi:PAS domain-containing protein
MNGIRQFVRMIVKFSPLYFSTFYVLLLDYFNRSLLHAASIFLFIILIILNLTPFQTTKEVIFNKGKWFLLFLLTVTIQLILLSTGGITSPAIVLIYIYSIALSFISTFQLSLFFLFSTILLLISDFFIHKNIYLITDRDVFLIVLQVILLLIINPLIYLLAQRYHLRDKLFIKVSQKLMIEESILATVSDLLIITDTYFHILSVNEAAERLLHQSQLSLANKPLFDSLILKGQNGVLINEQTLFKDAKKPESIAGEYVLFKSPQPQRKVTMKVKPLTDVDGKINQICFVINDSLQNIPSPQIYAESKARLEAMIEHLKKNCNTKELQGIKSQLLLMQKVEHDLFTIYNIENNLLKPRTFRADVALLARQIIQAEQDFSTFFHHSLTFSLPNFGQADVAPFSVERFPIKPEDLTGPFFTAMVDTTLLSLLFEKLVDLHILLGTSTAALETKVTLERKDAHALLLIVAGRDVILTEDERQGLFEPYYPLITTNTNLRLGSGLEGYLVNKLADLLKYHLQVLYDHSAHTLSFIVEIPQVV